MSDELIKLDRQHVWHPFTQEQTAPSPIAIESALGSVLTTCDGEQIVDLISSWWVNVYGHGHPKIVKAIQDQVAKLEQVIFAGFTHEPAVRLGSELARILPGELNHVFFSDDGSTAVEVALKVAYQSWRNRGEMKRTRLMSFNGGYHGDTLGAMTAGKGSGFFNHWSEMMFPVDLMPFPETWMNDVQVDAKESESLAFVDAHLAEHGHATFAMILEPLVQGASGMRMVRPGFVSQLMARLRAHGVLVIFDEVMTGFGRTGTSFACHQVDEAPDLICLSKGLTGGFLPMSVTVVTDSVYGHFLSDSFDSAFAHGHSFTANSLGCAAALASIELLESEAIQEDLARIERAHLAGIERMVDNPRAKNFRVSGTIGAFDVVVEDAGYESRVGPTLKNWFMDQGLLIRPLGNVLYLLPPYCTTDEQLDTAWTALDRALDLLAKAPTVED